MKKLYFLNFILFSVFTFPLFSQSFTIDDSLTPQQLVEDILFGTSNCNDNGSVTPTSNFNGGVANINSFGSFESGTSDFPLERGIILATGSANAAQNNPGNLGEGNTINTAWDDGNSGVNSDFGYPITNPTELDFLFTPRTSNTRFNYVFASDEYSDSTTNGCSNRDGFLFLIRRAGTSDSFTNIATIGGGNPVNIGTVRAPFRDVNGDELCTGVNESLLAELRSGTTNLFPEYTRRTIPLQTADGVFEAGQEYEVRILIADDGDFSRDSAVFIEQFDDNLEIDLTASAAGSSPVVIDNSGPLQTITACSSSVTLAVNTASFPQGTTFTWFDNGSEIPGENGSSLIVNTAKDGVTFSVEISLNGSTSCTITEDFILFFGQNSILDPIIFQSCVPNGAPLESTITLSDIDTSVNTTQSISYHSTETGAENDSDLLTGTYTANNGDVIFAQYIDEGCNFIVPISISINAGFNLNVATDCPYLVNDRGIGPALDGFEGYNLFGMSTPLCRNDLQPIPSVTDHFFENLPSTNDATLTYYTINNDGTRGVAIQNDAFASSSITLRAVLSDNNTGCESEIDVNITIAVPEGEIPISPATQLEDIEACDDGIVLGTDQNPNNLDGFARFNLEENFNKLLNEGDNRNRRVSFHASAGLAVCNTGDNSLDTVIALWDPVDSNNNIPAPTSYINDALFTTADVQRIGFRIENEIICSTDSNFVNRPAITGSFELRPRYLITNSFIQELQICDNLGSTEEELSDQIGEFDFQNLPVAGSNPPITITIDDLFLGVSNPNNYIIELYETRDQAINGNPSDLIDQSALFINQSSTNPLIPITEIFVKVIDNNTMRMKNGIEIPNENFNCFDVESFELIVNPAIDITAPTDTIQLCDEDSDGRINAASLVAFFENDPTFIDSFLTNDPSVSRTYFLTETKAINNTPLLQNDNQDFETNFVVDGQNTLFVRVVNPVTLCFDIEPFTYVINRAPLLNDISNNPIITCYDESNIDLNSPSLEIDVTQNQSLIFTDSSYTATYFTNETDARNNVNELTISEATNFNILDPQFAGVTSIWYRVINNTTGCVSFEEQLLNTNERADIVTSPQEFVECLDPLTAPDINNRFFDFDLTTQNNRLLNLESIDNPNGNSQTDLVVQYYENSVDANEIVTNGNPRSTIVDFTSYTNTTANEQTIFYRLESSTNPNCISDIGELTLRVGLFTEFLRPTIGKCDDDNIAGTGGKFNLTRIAQRYNTNNEIFTVSFHSSSLDAQNNTAPLGVPDVDENGDPILSYTTSSFDEEVFPRIINSVGCVDDQTSLILTTFFKPDLDPNSQIILSVCDVNLPAGFETFDLLNLLSINSPQINFLDPRINNNQTLRNSISINFFENDETDASGRFINQIPDTAPAGNNTTSNYIVSNTTEVIYIELESNQGCFSQAQVTLNVDPLPEFIAPSDPILICEDAFGSNQFDNTLLTLNTIFRVPEAITPETLANTPDPNALSFTYFFRTSNEVQPNSSNLITDATDDDITAGEIFVVLTNTNTLCTTSQIVSIAPKTLPEITAPLVPVICDEDTDVTDGITNYDLSIFDEEILNPTGTAVNDIRDLSDFSIAYFNTANIELIGTTQLTNSEVITAMIIDNRETPNCQNTVDFTIDIQPQPFANQPDPALLSVCDVDNLQDGIASFNFGASSNQPSALKSSILNGQPENLFTVTYYDTIDEAIADTNNLNPIPTEATSQEYIAKVTNNASGCFNTVAFTITVNLLPQFSVPTNPVTICANGDSGQESAMFSNTLDQLTILFNNSTSTLTTPSDNLEYSFFFKENGDTEPVMSRLITATNGDNIPQTDIFIVLTNTVTSCFQVQEITLQPRPLPRIIAPSNPVICDDNSDNLGDTDGQITSGLSSFNDEILNPLGNSTPPADFRNPADFTIRYYDTLIPVRNEITETSTLIDGTTYTAEITDNRDPLLCTNSVDFTLIIPRQAVIFQPSAIQQCSPNNVTTVDFTDLSNTILQNESNPGNFNVTFHNSVSEANSSSVNTISNPLTSNNYIAKITNNTNQSSCFKTIPFEVIVNTQPVINTAATLEYCENETDLDFETNGISIRERLNQLLVSDRENLIITYHNSLNDANSNIATNTLNTTLFVKAVRDFSGLECETIAEITLTEIAQPVVNPITDTSLLEICDTDIENDGNFVFDFFALNNDILGSQPANDFSISYHVTMEDAENNITIPIGQSISTGTYFVKVQQARAGCFTIESLNIAVETIPTIELEDIVFCRNDPDRIINAGTFNPSFTYLWEFKDDLGNTIRASETTNSISLSVNDINANITLTITDPNTLNNCNNSTTIRVTESASPVITPIILKNFEANEVTINVEEEGDFLYGFNDSSILNAQESNTFTDLLPGKFTLYVFDINGCEPASVDVVFVDYFPSFTPNGNGPIETELWHIQGIETIPETLVYIYNRYGKLLKTLTSRSAGWDGTYNGSPLPSDDYWILIRLPDGEEIKDHITLKR